MTAKDARGAVAYDGTAALKMTAPEAPTKKHRFLRRKPAGKVKKAEKTERPSVLAKLNQFKELVKNAVVDRTRRKELER